MLRKLLIFLIVLVVLVAAAGAGAVWYVSPSKSLDLAYTEVPLRDRAIGMVKRLSLDLVLSEDDVNNLGKKEAASRVHYRPDVDLTGAQFRLMDGLLVADVNAKWKGLVPFGVTIRYQLKWQSPNLVAEVVDAKVKGIKLPADTFDDMVFPLGDELPKLIKVKEIETREDDVVVTFKKPSLSDLAQLIG